MGFPGEMQADPSEFQQDIPGADNEGYANYPPTDEFSR